RGPCEGSRERTLWMRRSRERPTPIGTSAQSAGADGGPARVRGSEPSDRDGGASMSTALLISNVVLWVLVVVLIGIVAVLVQQVGVLYERVAPAGALMVARGPAIGDAAPAVTAASLDGSQHTIGGARADGRSTLLFFLSPTCPVCKTLLPALRSIARV